jgi:hypothetical protein
MKASQPIRLLRATIKILLVTTMVRLLEQTQRHPPTPSDPGDSTAAKVGGAMVFDGNAAGIEVSADASFNWLATDSFSIGCWVKPPLNPPTTLEIVI